MAKEKPVQLSLPESLHSQIKALARKKNTYLNPFYVEILKAGLALFLSAPLTEVKEK